MVARIDHTGMRRCCRQALSARGNVIAGERVPVVRGTHPAALLPVAPWPDGPPEPSQFCVLPATQSLAPMK
jgi:hypothetical protein